MLAPTSDLLTTRDMKSGVPRLSLDLGTLAHRSRPGNGPDVGHHLSLLRLAFTVEVHTKGVTAAPLPHWRTRVVISAYRRRRHGDHVSAHGSSHIMPLASRRICGAPMLRAATIRGVRREHRHTMPSVRDGLTLGIVRTRRVTTC